MGWTDLASNPPYLARRHPGVRRLHHRAGPQDRRAHRAGRLHAGAHDHHEVQQARFVDASRSRRSTPTRPCACAPSWPRRSPRPRCSSSPRRAAAPSSRGSPCAPCATRLGRRACPRRSWSQHLVAITDPGSDLERQAPRGGLGRPCCPGEPSVGGRFSALSVFGLLPAALVGIDLERAAWSTPWKAEQPLQRGRHRQPGHRPGSVPVRQLPAGTQQVLVPHAEARSRAAACGSSSSWPKAWARTARASCRTSR